MASSLLEVALRGANPHVMLTGASLPIPEILEKLRVLTSRPVEFVDARSATSADQLRRDVAERIKSNDGAIVFLTGSMVPPAVRDVLDEVLEGRVNLGPGSAVDVPSATPVLALVPTTSPELAMRDLFVTNLPAERALAPLPEGGDGLFPGLSS